MVCDLCHTNHATIHITEIINSQKKEVHLCDECAKQKGITHKFQISLSDLLGGLIEQKAGKPLKELQAIKCPNCGITYQELRSKVRLGCANDLEVFKDWLQPFIEKIHNASQHTGKLPKQASDSMKKENQLMKLRRDLEEAIRREDFEKAAKLRDQIRSLETEMGSSR